MKIKLYKKWLKKCRHVDGSCFSRMYTRNYEKYASALGDKFFEKYIKYSRFWHKIKVECDLNECTPKRIHCQDHPLHSYCPSVRLNNWQLASNFICDVDFAYMYQTVIQISDAVINSRKHSTLIQKKTV